jgi:hypothetical protein
VRPYVQASDGGAFSRHDIGCYSYPVQTDIIIAGVATPSIVANNPTRVYLAFSNPTPGQRIVITTKPTQSITQGIIVPTNNYPLEFNREDHGPLVTAEWGCISAAINANLSVIEIFLICSEDSRGHSKYTGRELYARSKHNNTLSPDHGFTTSGPESASRWASLIASGSKPLQYLDRGITRRLGSRVYDAAGGAGERPLRDIWVKYQR